jgi:hypothetical protein
VLACPSSPLLGFDAGNGDVGPLTQMAAANAPVAAAFCPHCGSFLEDLGITQQQAQHVATCSHQLEAAAAGAAAGGPAAQPPAAAVQQPQQQHAGDAIAGTRRTPPGQLQQQQNRQQLGGGLASSSDDGVWEDDDAELGGNCSEQDEASQAAAEGRLAAGQAGEEAGVEEVAAAQAAAEAQAEQVVLQGWLAHHGLDKYAEHFFRAGASGRGCGRPRAQGGQGRARAGKCSMPSLMACWRGQPAGKAPSLI